MKWPAYLVVIRHAQSAYNLIKQQMGVDPLYGEFRREFDLNFRSPRCLELAVILNERYRVIQGDYDTPITPTGIEEARATGSKLSTLVPPPDVVFVSPYLRTRQTFDEMVVGGLVIGSAKVIYDDRIREREHGLKLLYNDQKIFHAFHPEQKYLHDLQGPYWYQFPQGESIPQVRDRIRSITNTFVREYAGDVVYIISHHLTQLAMLANYQKLTPELFMELDRTNRPKNCGVTVLRGNPKAGKDGKLELTHYSQRLC